MGSAHSVLATMGLSPLTACSFMVYTAQAPRCSAGELCKLGPWLHALPRSKLLRIRFSGTPQRRRLCWACVLCRSQVRAAQATRCLVSALSLSGSCVLSPPGPSPLVSRVPHGSAVSGVPCVSSGELISGCDLPGRCPGSQEDLVSSWEPAHSLVEDVLSGAEIAAAPCLQALAVSSLLLCLCAGRGRYTAC